MTVLNFIWYFVGSLRLQKMIFEAGTSCKCLSLIWFDVSSDISWKNWLFSSYVAKEVVYLVILLQVVMLCPCIIQDSSMTEMCFQVTFKVILCALSISAIRSASLSLQIGHFPSFVQKSPDLVHFLSFLAIFQTCMSFSFITREPFMLQTCYAHVLDLVWSGLSKYAFRIYLSSL